MVGCYCNPLTGEVHWENIKTGEIIPDCELTPTTGIWGGC